MLIYVMLLYSQDFWRGIVRFETRLKLEASFPGYEAVHSYGGPEEIQTKLELVSVK